MNGSFFSYKSHKRGDQFILWATVTKKNHYILLLWGSTSSNGRMWLKLVDHKLSSFILLILLLSSASFFMELDKKGNGLCYCFSLTYHLILLLFLKNSFTLLIIFIFRRFNFCLFVSNLFTIFQCIRIKEIK